MLKQGQRVKDRFEFKQFTIEQDQCTMKVGTDGILLGAWADIEQSDKVLDIGTGTGLISLMLAQRAENAVVHSVEIDENACEQAQSNFENSPFAARLTAFNDPIQDYASISRESYDLIVSNPPFFSGGTFSANQSRNDVRHTVKLPNGDLLSSARRLLKQDGRFCVVLPLIEGLRFKERAITYGLHCTKLTEVIPKAGKAPNRVLMQFEKQDNGLEENSMMVWEDVNQYTDTFVGLTKDFYLFL